MREREYITYRARGYRILPAGPGIFFSFDCTRVLYCMGQAIPIVKKKKKTFYQPVLKLSANEASAQGLQNAV